MARDPRKRIIGKEQIIYYSAFLLEAVIVIGCYISESAKWSDTVFLSVASARLVTGCITASLLIFSLASCIFFKQLAVEKKLLILLGSMTVFFGVMGSSPLIFGNEFSFFDALYRSIQLFVGEFGDFPFEKGTFPVTLDIARFLALFVAFGTIVIILFREKMFYLSVRLFYRDVVIVTDKLDGYISDLADKYLSAGRKVVIGYIQDDMHDTKMSDGYTPVISFDIDKNIKTGLKRCNIANARCIYLLCGRTSDNIRLIREIQPYYIRPSDNASQIGRDEGEIIRKDHETVDELVCEYIDIVRRQNDTASLPKEKKKIRSTICYIQYQDDSEREFYSLDDVFTNRNDGFTTYFINLKTVTIRQMLSKVSVWKYLGITGSTDPDMIMDRLDEFRICVSGSEKYFAGIVTEIARICVFNKRIPLVIHYLADEGDDPKNNAPCMPKRLRGLVDIKPCSLDGFAGSGKHINIFFIGSDDEMQIRSTLHRIFQSGLHESIDEYIVLSDGSMVEYEILQKYISAITSGNCQPSAQESGPVIRLGNVIDLMLSIDDFYHRYGPTSREIHKAYRKALSGSMLTDFNKLPEIYTESNLLSSLHNKYIIDIIDEMINKSSGGDIKDRIIKLLRYLAATEHERWFNERNMQGCIYSEEQDYLLNKNPYLLHWDSLDPVQQDDNIRYVAQSLIFQRLRDKKKQAGTYHDDIIDYRLGHR